MKKESVNTFNEGLNYDLNPITTPNNVLVDNVNGTFITFNGDELALQNDAGNTKILIPGTSDYVQLSEGFYPLGVKEYGGVLYIVSGYSKINSALEWDSTKSYLAGEVVIYNGIYYYAESNNMNIISLQTSSILAEDEGILLNEDGGFSLLESGESWKPIGSTKEEAKVGILDYESDYIEKVEFGSYPSPEILTEELAGNGLPFNFESATKNSLYSSNVLNDTIFKAGEYATFESNSLDTSNITRINYVDNVKSSDIKIYVAKLYLQLTNGFIDLTSDVWEEYAQFKGGTITNQFWFNDPDFKYYCKSNFKGKLVMSIELEDLSFILNYYNVDQVEQVGNIGDVNYVEGGYKLTFNITLSNPTDWTITKLRINYFLDGVPYISSPTDISLGVSPSDYQITLPFSNEGKILDFNITPIFYYPGTTTDVTNELPITYLDKYTLSGSELLSNVFNYDTNDYEGNDYY